jgi:drug/metabolite transporter (DMT)-like permease
MAEAIQPRVPVRAYGVIAIGLLAVSLAAIFIRLAQVEGVPSLLIAAGRLTLASLLLTPWVLLNYRPELGRLTGNQLALAATAGFFLSIHFATWILSLEHTAVLISVVLVSTGPLWIALLEMGLLNAHIGVAVFGGLALAVVGGVLIGYAGAEGALPGQDPLLGALLALAGAVTFAIYMVIGRKLRATLTLLPYIWLVYSCAAATLVLAVLVTATPVAGHSADGYLWVAALGLIPQLIGHSSFNYAVRYLPATFIGIVAQLEPVASAFIAFLRFHEIPNTLQIVGSAVILVGVTLAGLAQARSK